MSRKIIESGITEPVGITAHAKVNLMLHVTGRADNGYHHLQSVFAFTKFGDLLSIKPDSVTNVSFIGEFADAVGTGENSVTRALSWYFQQLQLSQRHYRIVVTKNIPVAAGLGGGTSDAAALLAYLFKTDHPDADEAQSWDFVKQSGELGADVPVSLAFHLGLGRIFWVEGSGREGNCRPMLTKGLARQLVLVNPGKRLSTADVFAALGGRFDPPVTCPEVLTQDFLKNTRNILQAPALQLVPDLGKLFMVFMLDASFQYFRLSGSGASCFVVYRERHRADAIARKLSANNRGWWVQRTELVLGEKLRVI